MNPVGNIGAQSFQVKALCLRCFHRLALVSQTCCPEGKAPHYQKLVVKVPGQPLVAGPRPRSWEWEWFLCSLNASACHSHPGKLPLTVFIEIKNLEILIVFLILPSSPPKLCHALNSLAGYIVLHDLVRRKQCTDVSGS